MRIMFNKFPFNYIFSNQYSKDKIINEPYKIILIPI